MLRRVLPFLVIALLACGFAAEAQSNVDECRVSPSEDFYYFLTDTDFEGCLNALYNQMLDRSDSEIYGDWARATDIYISADGEIDTADAGSGKWTNWGSFASDTTNTSSMSMEEIFGTVEQDLTNFWSGVFQNQGIDYQKPDLVLWDGSAVDTRCGIVSAEEGPLYCPFDDTIYFPVGFSEWLYSLGDFAVAAAIAHEWGHSVQDRIGVLGNLATIDTELQADCFAGAYAEYISNSSELLTLEDGDIQEGADTFFTLGDPEGTNWFDSRAHGSGTQREQSFETGVDQGYSAC
ncbi:MAG: neutral zinc metallopeptidase [Chloroflexota bacterium]